MRTLRASWRIFIAIVGLLLLLTACDNGSGPNSVKSTVTPSPALPPIPAQSTVSFTASGGLSGAYTINDTGRGSTYTTQSLRVVVGDQNWFFTMSYSAYAGPQTYSFSYTPTKPPWGSAGFSSKDGTKAWQLFPPAACQLAVTSDVALRPADGGQQYHEVKATFSCPSLSSPSGSTLTISDGQFDIVALVVSLPQPTETPTPTTTPSPTSSPTPSA